MDLDAIIAELEAEITRLKRARRGAPVKRGRGRPKVVPIAYSKRSILSPEACAGIAAAQKRRRAAAKKAIALRELR
jgi:hypothetical protein